MDREENSMRKFLSQTWKHAIAGLFGISTISAAGAQEPPTPPVMVVPGQPVIMPPVPAPTTAFGELIVSPLALPVNTQAGQTPQAPPLLGSQPPPFQVPPSTPAA